MWEIDPMQKKPFRWQAVKAAICASKVIVPPIAPCEILAPGARGVLEINGLLYAVEILGYLPEVGEPVIDGYRLTKGNGEAHDICLVAGRMECSCGDWIFRRSCQTERSLADCKHTKAIGQHFAAPVDQKPIASPVLSTVELEDL
jgi:hypothetical protein